MIFYDLPIDIKKYILSYNLGDVRLFKIKSNSIIINYINKFKPVYKSYKLNNKQCFEIDNINIDNGISYIFNLSELDKLHQKHKPLKLLIDYVMFINTESIKSLCPVDNCILTSNNLFDIYYLMNKHINDNTNTFINNVNDFISLRLKKITIKVINEDRQSFISNLYSYFFN